MPVDTTYQALIQTRADLTAEARTAIDAAMARDDRALTDEEKERDDAINVELDSLNVAIEVMEKQRDRERAVSADKFKMAGGGMDINHEVLGRTKPNTPSGGPFASFGDQLQTIHRAQMGDVAAKDRLVQVAEFHQHEFQAAPFGSGIAIDSDGGFLVQTDFSSDIMRRINEVGGLISRVRMLPLSGDANGIKLPMVDESSRVDGSRWGGVQGYWVAEGIAPTASNATFAQLALELHKVAALGYATEELLSHVSAMTAFFTEAFAEELRFKVEDAIFEGDGAGKPEGFTNSNAIISITKETGQAANTVLHENLRNMWARMDARSRANSVWFINQDVEPALDDLAKVIGTAGVEPNYVTFTPEGVQRIKGRPVVPLEYCSTLGTVDDIVLADMSQYTMVDRGGVQQAQSLHVRFTTDEMAFRATYRVDGGSTWKQALTPFKGSSTTSPFVTLNTRA